VASSFTISAYNCNHSSAASERHGRTMKPPVEIFAGKKRFVGVDDLSGRDAVQVACARALFSQRGDRDNPEGNVAGVHVCLAVGRKAGAWEGMMRCTLSKCSG
jgi:hypothetical protein